MNKINMSIIAEQLNISRQAVSQIFSEDHSINNMTYRKIVEKLPEVAECFEPTKYKINRQKYEKLKKKINLRLAKERVAMLEKELEEANGKDWY